MTSHLHTIMIVMTHDMRKRRHGDDEIYDHDGDHDNGNGDNDDDEAQKNIHKWRCVKHCFLLIMEYKSL